MSDFTLGAVIYILIAALLVITLLVGAFLIVNLGLMSKRPEDRVGGRTPSDVGILQHRLWPETPYKKTELPAEEDEVDVKASATSAPSNGTQPAESTRRRAG